MRGIIHQAPTALFRVGTPSTVFFFSNHRPISFPCKMLDITQRSGVENSFNFLKSPNELVVIAHLIYQIILLGQVYQLFGLIRIKAKRFLSKNVNFHLQQFFYHFIMKLGWYGYKNGIRTFLFQHFCEILVTGEFGILF